jgi:hypothetical protein
MTLPFVIQTLLLRKVMCFPIAYKHKSVSLVTFHFVSLIGIYTFLSRIWRTTPPSTTSLIDLHSEDTELEICILCVIGWNWKCVRFVLTWNISVSDFLLYNGPFWIQHHMPGRPSMRPVWHKIGARLRFLKHVYQTNKQHIKNRPVGPNRLSISFILPQIFSCFWVDKGLFSSWYRQKIARLPVLSGLSISGLVAHCWRQASILMYYAAFCVLFLIQI